MNEETRKWLDDQLQKIKAYPPWGDMAPFADKLFEAVLKLNEAMPHGTKLVNCGVGHGGAIAILSLARHAAGKVPSVRGFDRGGIALRKIRTDFPQSGVDHKVFSEWSYTDKDSVTAADDFLDDQVGVVVLDTKPTLHQVRAELIAWDSKIAACGQIWVHDYTNLAAGLGVKTAVDQFIADHPEYSLEVLPEPPGFAILKKGEKDGSQQGEVLQRDGNGRVAGGEGDIGLSGDQAVSCGTVAGDGVLEDQPVLGDQLPSDPGQGPGDPGPTETDNRHP